MSPFKIIFLFGGPGDEHEISLATTQNVITQFPEHYLILPVFIDQDKKWNYLVGYVRPADAWHRAKQTMSVAKQLPEEIALDYIESIQPNVVFIGLHARYGEDGTVQASLESRGLPYTGSNPEASALAMDKPRVLQLLQDEMIGTPEFLEVNETVLPADIQAFIDFHGYPIVVLPADSGSSVGTSLVKSADALGDALTRARLNSSRAMISKYIAGSEFTCGVLVTDKTNLIALPPTEIKPIKRHEFWDYEAKYTAGECEEITPAKREPELLKRIGDLAKRVHRLVGADGYSRTDMILGEDNELYILEINTLPGLTAMSAIPAQAQALGMNLSQLLDTICQNALIRT